MVFALSTVCCSAPKNELGYTNDALKTSQKIVFFLEVGGVFLIIIPMGILILVGQQVNGLNAFSNFFYGKIGAYILLGGGGSVIIIDLTSLSVRLCRHRNLWFAETEQDVIGAIKEFEEKEKNLQQQVEDLTTQLNTSEEQLTIATDRNRDLESAVNTAKQETVRVTKAYTERQTNYTNVLRENERLREEKRPDMSRSMQFPQVPTGEPIKPSSAGSSELQRTQTPPSRKDSKQG